MNTTKTLGLLFLGRLEKEKGFDLIYDFISQYPGKELPFDRYIFGSGSYESGILELSYHFKQIHFFGWKPLSEVERYLGNIDYCLMPSRFLETFGLSAINILQQGIPIVGFKKGGLIPFIQDEYAIEQSEGSTDLAKFSNMLIKLQQEKKKKKSDFYEQLAQQSKDIANRYTVEKRYERFLSLTWTKKPQKIVLVSDFINKIGGIETYLHDTKHLLQQHGHQVKLFWGYCPKGPRGKLKKLLGIGLSLVNLFAAIRFYLFLKREKPDLIRYHSMIRRNGWLLPRIARKFPATKRMMYHDFGYFTPYPHALTDTKQIKTPLSLKNYLAMTQTSNPLKKLLTFGKYLSLSLLIKRLKKTIDLHLVPSEFMEPIVQKSLKISPNKITAFNHFLQK